MNVCMYVWIQISVCMYVCMLGIIGTLGYGWMNVSGFLRKCSGRYIQLDFPAQHVCMYVCNKYV